MIPAETLPLIIALCLAYLLATGLVSLTWGRRFPNCSGPLVGSGIFVLAIALGLSANGLLQANQAAAPWLRGWIWPRMEGGSITVGVLQDYLGLVAAGLLTFVSALLVLTPRELALAGARDARCERFPAGVALGLAGGALAWTAMTPWYGFVGILLSTLGGFLALGSRWDQDGDAALSVQLLWQRSCGLTLAVVGACGLSSSGLSLQWSAQAWTGAGDSPANVLGLSLFLAGLALQLQPFPVLGWLVSPSQSPTLHRVSLAQVFPAWAALALLVRVQPFLHGQPVLQVFGWVMFASAVLSLISGFFQSQWRSGLALWLSAAFALCAAFLAFSGPWIAFAFLVASTLGALSMAMAATALEMGGTSSNSNRTRALWSKIAAATGLLAATGLAGFASASGLLRWMTLSWADTELCAVSGAVVFLYISLGGKIGWRITRLKTFTQAPWLLILSPLALVLVAMGWLWTGALTGGALFGNPDQLMPSFLDWILPVAANPAAGALRLPDEGTFWSATGLFWGIFVTASALGFWAAGKAAAARAEALADFVARGYRIEELARWALAWVARLGSGMQWLVDEKSWRGWIPGALSFGVRHSASAASRGDKEISSRLREALRHAVELPAKGLQLIQNGDVQWYLIFAMGSAIAILLHFLRFK